METDFITVVSGLPRSGTSLTMKMLEAGGLEPVTDGQREADEDNPKGYYEFERVKQLKDDSAWLAQARGKAVKVISALLKDLPADYHYRVVFVRRKMDEILASQKQMLVRRGELTDRVSDVELTRLFEKHLVQVEEWLAQQPNFLVIYVNYNEILSDPTAPLDEINRFLGGRLDVRRMASVIDRSLYRQQR